MQLPFILCLMGPTGCGKTALAIELVKRFPFEIISVDSAMVYRGLDLGTAKPTEELLRLAPHRLLNIRDPAEVYSAGHFREDALREIRDIQAQGKMPLLVGGTMLYFYVLQYGLDNLPVKDPSIRAQIQEEAEIEGWANLHRKLERIDPKAHARIHPHDRQRIQRALEVHALTGKPLTEQQLGHASLQPYPLHHFILCPVNRSWLHQRIEERFLSMLDQGFIEEVQKLRERSDLSLETPSMRSVGYRQVWEYLDGKWTFEEMKKKAIVATRQLAKRQITWLKRFENASRFNCEEEDLLEKVLRALKNLCQS